MKKYLFLLCFLLSTALFAEHLVRPYLDMDEQMFFDETSEYIDELAPLPLQAAVCDVIGIGHVQNVTTNAFLIKMDSLWYGSLSNVTLTADSCIELLHYNQIRFPTNNTPILFFFSKYRSFYGQISPKGHYQYILNMEDYRRRHQPDGFYLYEPNASWIPVVPEEAAVIEWCSNLVTYSQIQPNRQKFYELLRDGYRQKPSNSRICRNSTRIFSCFNCFNPPDFISQVWNDTNLVGIARLMVQLSCFSSDTNTVHESDLPPGMIP